MGEGLWTQRHNALLLAISSELDFINNVHKTDAYSVFEGKFGDGSEGARVQAEAQTPGLFGVIVHCGALNLCDPLGQLPGLITKAIAAAAAANNATSFCCSNSCCFYCSNTYSSNNSYLWWW